MKDCYWLLSAMLEYALHKNVYKAFKETTSDNFKNSDHVNTPKPINMNIFAEYSKFSNKEATAEALKCDIVNYEKEHLIDKIPAELYPNQK